MVAAGVFGSSSCTDLGSTMKKVAKDAKSKLCCMELTCPPTTTTTTEYVPTLEDKFECAPGQGGEFKTYLETGDNSFESCGALCADDDDCMGFDFTSAESWHPELHTGKLKKADACRLFKANTPRMDEMSGRSYCAKKGAEAPEEDFEEAATEASMLQETSHQAAVSRQFLFCFQEGGLKGSRSYMLLQISF